MADVFLHDDGGVSSFIADVEGYLEEYTTSVDALEQLLKVIESSEAWEDAAVKTSFVNTLSSYIVGYKSFAAGIGNYVECLKLKSDNLVEHEDRFS